MAINQFLLNVNVSFGRCYWMDQINYTNSIHVVTDEHAFTCQQEVARALEMRFNEEDFAVGGIITGGETMPLSLSTR